MLTENDASLMTISFISELDLEFTQASEAFRNRFNVSASAAVRCIKYRYEATTLAIEAYLEVDISPDFTFSFVLDVQFSGKQWTVSRTIQRDGVTSEQIHPFAELQTDDFECLAQIVMRPTAEGVRELDRLTNQQLAA